MRRALTLGGVHENNGKRLISAIFGPALALSPASRHLTCAA
jgi:hypothetical protein